MDILAEATTWAFDGFLVDRRARVLFRLDKAGVATRVPIGSRAFDILCMLMGRGGSFVSKQELLDTVWPGVTVEENNLTVQMSALRRALDAGRQEGSCIQTIPGRGYRFLPEISRPTVSDENIGELSGGPEQTLPNREVVEQGAIALGAQATEAQTPASRRWRVRTSRTAALCVLAATLLVALVWYNRTPPTGSMNKSVIRRLGRSRSLRGYGRDSAST